MQYTIAFTCKDLFYKRVFEYINNSYATKLKNCYFWYTHTKKSIHEPLLSLPLSAPAISHPRYRRGKKEKLRPGDILGALTGDMGLAAKDVGKIDIYEKQSYVAITKELVESMVKKPFKIKGKTLPTWAL